MTKGSKQRSRALICQRFPTSSIVSSNDSNDSKYNNIIVMIVIIVIIIIITIIIIVITLIIVRVVIIVTLQHSYGMGSSLGQGPFLGPQYGRHPYTKKSGSEKGPYFRELLIRLMI